MDDIPIEGDIDQAPTQLDTIVGSEEPGITDGDLIEGLDAEPQDEDQPKRKKLRKRVQSSNESDKEDEVAPLDEDGDANGKEDNAKDDKSDNGDDDAGDEPAELPDDEDGNQRRRKRKRNSESGSASGGEEEPNNDNDDYGSDNESKKKRGKRGKKNSKRKRGRDGDEGAGDDTPKSKKAAQKQQKEENELIIAQQLKEEAFAFVSSMNEACDADITCNKSNQPALNKIKLLPKVQEMLARLKMHMYLIDCGVLHAVRKWLEPLPDRTLPNVRVRETLLRALEHLPVTENHLQESRIGRIVMFLLKNDAETPSNKTLAKKLIDKWSRPVFELSSNWMDLQYHDEVRTLRKLARPAQGAAEPQQPADDELLDTKQEVAPPSKKLKVTDFLARMPEKSTMEFTVRPMSAIDPETKGQRQLSATEVLERKLRKTKGSGESRHASVGVTKANRK